MHTGRGASLCDLSISSCFKSTLSLLALVLLVAPPARAISSPSPAVFALEALDEAEAKAAEMRVTCVSEDEPPAPKSPAAPLVPAGKLQPVRLVRFDKPPLIDGQLDEEIWQQAATLNNFYQTQPGDNIAPTHQTEVLLGYDAKFLYIAFRAFDEPGKVRATVAKRDSVLEDDNVRIILDTFNDGRRAYAFVFNPLGVQQDGILTEEQGEDYSVDVVMESKGVVREDGYTVEVAIPFKSLRYEAGKGKVWGVHAFRRIKHLNNEQDSWMPIRRDKSGLLNQAGQITGLEGISTERTLELIPSLTVSETGKRIRAAPPAPFPSVAPLSDNGRMLNKPVELDFGLTAKFSLTPTVTLDFAYNPDFAQVEADSTVVTTNQRFPIFFEEKRPFFLEGKDIFETTMVAVNTRAIIDPDYAVKLTGKRGRNSFGVLVASDNAPGNYSDEERDDPQVRPGIERFLDKNAYIGILRLKRDVGRDSSIGLIATTYSFIERHNQLAGFDGRFRLNPQTILSFQALGTTSRRFFFDPEAGRDVYRTGNAFGYAVVAQRTTRNLFSVASAVGRTRDYRADVGFTRRVDTNLLDLYNEYHTDQRTKGRFTNFVLGNYNKLQYDWQGRMQGWNAGARAFFNFRRQSWVGFGFDNYFERLFEEEFGQKRTATRRGAFAGADNERSSNNKSIYLSAGSTPSKKFSFFLDVNYNIGALDFDFGAGKKYPRVSAAALRDPDAPLDPGAGNSVFVNGSLNLQPTDALRMTLSYTKSRLVRRDTGRVAFDANIYSLRSTYQFTRFLFARARVDYDSIPANVRGQFLLGWTPNPGTSLYVGYNDDLNRNGFNPFNGELEPGFRRNGRTFFVKTSYLFRRSL